MKNVLLAVITLAMLSACSNMQTDNHSAAIKGYKYINGYPTAQTAQKAYDEADFNRAVQMYRFFYPTVAILGTWHGNLANGVIPNKVYALLNGSPNQIVFTPNSDTPYAGMALDTSKVGPIVIDIPAGPIMAAGNDLNQLHVFDLGLPGPDKGKGGKHLLLPPNYKGKIPAGYHIGRPTTNEVLVLVRAIPTTGNMDDAVKLIKTVKTYPLDKNAPWDKTEWIDLSKTKGDFTPLKWEDNIKYWEVLAQFINKEPANPEYRAVYGELAELGIKKDTLFNPDARMKDILERAAKTGWNIMRVQSFADRRPERVAWQDRQWEWAVLLHDNGKFEAENYIDLYAREKWFYQAQIESPAMFSRTKTAGSLYWLGLKDSTGKYLDGSKTYKLTVPLPVPDRLFWSVTVYDNETRSEISTDQNWAALRSLFELKNKIKGVSSIDLYFGPSAPLGKEDVWIKTIPAKGWFTYFRIYGPQEAAFDGTWKPGDFEEVK